MKKILIFIAVAITFSCASVLACENKEELIRDNFDYLSNIYPDYVIEGMTCDQIQTAIDNEYVLVDSKELDEADEYPPTRSTATYSTANKTITLYYYSGNSGGLIQFQAIWKSIPSVRSHDIIAIRTNGPSYSLSSATSFFRYSTSTTSNQINSTSSSNNVTSASNGVGFVYKIPTGSLTSLKFYMDTGVSGSGTVAASYQHAKSSVSKANAMNYYFSGSGLGGVIKHNSNSISSKYDGMSGVSLSI